MLYAAGEGGVFRSLDNGTTWAFYPTSDPAGIDGTPTPPGDGGGLPNAIVTSLSLVLGNIDPTNGRPDISTGPNTLYATTFGRGDFTIRLAPTVFPNTKANPSVLHLSQTLPGPGGSDTGLSNSDQITDLAQPFIEGLSEQSAFGSVVTISLYDMTDGSKAPVFIGLGQTDAAGRFSVQINPGIYASDGSTDGVKVIGIQATDQSSTKGNLARFTFTLDTTAPVKPLKPVLDPANDTGRSNSDGVTQATKPIIDLAGIEPTRPWRSSIATAGRRPVGSLHRQRHDPGQRPRSPTVTIRTSSSRRTSPGTSASPSDPLVITASTRTAARRPAGAPDLQAASDSGLVVTPTTSHATSPGRSSTSSATETTAHGRPAPQSSTPDPISSYVLVSRGSTFRASRDVPCQTSAAPCRRRLYLRRAAD